MEKEQKKQGLRESCQVYKIEFSVIVTTYTGEHNDPKELIESAINNYLPNIELLSDSKHRVEIRPCSGIKKIPQGEILIL